MMLHYIHTDALHSSVVWQVHCVFTFQQVSRGQMRNVTCQWPAAAHIQLEYCYKVI